MQRTGTLLLLFGLIALVSRCGSNEVRKSLSVRNEFRDVYSDLHQVERGVEGTNDTEDDSSIGETNVDSETFETGLPGNRTDYSESSSESINGTNEGSPITETNEESANTTIEEGSSSESINGTMGGSSTTETNEDSTIEDSSSEIQGTESSEESCCLAHSEPGCADSAGEVAECVCGLHPSCCYNISGSGWTDLCVSIGRFICDSPCPISEDLYKTNYLETHVSPLIEHDPHSPSLLLYPKIRTSVSEVTADRTSWLSFEPLGLSEVSGTTGLYVYTLGLSELSFNLTEQSFVVDESTNGLVETQHFLSEIGANGAQVRVTQHLYERETQMRLFGSGVTVVPPGHLQVEIQVQGWPFASTENRLAVSLRFGSNRDFSSSVRLDHTRIQGTEEYSKIDAVVFGSGDTAMRLSFFNGAIVDATTETIQDPALSVSSVQQLGNEKRTIKRVTGSRSAIYLTAELPSFTESASWNSYFTIQRNAARVSEEEDLREEEEESDDDVNVIIIAVVVPVGSVIILSLVILLIVLLVIMQLKCDGGIKGAVGRFKLPCSKGDEGIWWDDQMGVETGMEG